MATLKGGISIFFVLVVTLLFLGSYVIPRVHAAETIAGSGNGAFFFDGIDDIGGIETNGILCNATNTLQFEDFTIEWWHYRMDDNAVGGTILASADSSGIDLSEEGPAGLKWGIASESGKCQKSYYEYLPVGDERRWVVSSVPK